MRLCNTRLMTSVKNNSPTVYNWKLHGSARPVTKHPVGVSAISTPHCRAFMHLLHRPPALLTCFLVSLSALHALLTTQRPRAKCMHEAALATALRSAWRQPGAMNTCSSQGHGRRGEQHCEHTAGSVTPCPPTQRNAPTPQPAQAETDAPRPTQTDTNTECPYETRTEHVPVVGAQHHMVWGGGGQGRGAHGPAA